MSSMYIDVDTAIAVAVNVAPLLVDTDFKTIEEAVAYNAAGMDLNWNFITTAGVQTQTNVVPTTAGSHDWTHVGNGMYKLEITASAGTINNDTEGTGWFSGFITGVLPFVGPRMTFRAAALNNALIDGGAVLGVNIESSDDIDLTATQKTSVNTEADTAITDAALATAANLATVDTVVDSILVDTATTIPATITTLTTNVATVDTVVDGIQTDLSNATDGLGAIKTAIDTANTDLANGTDGLGALKALIDTIDTVVDGIQTDLSNGTDGLGAIKTAVDTVDTVADSILVDTAEIGTAGAGLTDLGGMSTAMKAEVNVEALDVLVTDTHVQPTSVPAATSSIKDKINWLFTLARNKVTQTATTATLRNDDDDTTIATSTDSDDGTTATKGEWS